MLAGHATAEATAARVRLGAATSSLAALGPEPLTLSSVGIGTYLGAADAETDARYADALQAALDGGLNLIDTAINYRAQASERVVGQLLASGRVARESLVVCTKAGFVPKDRDAPDRAKGLLAGVPPEEVVDGSHCLHPRFVEACLARSRENLRLQTIDVFYLHNPETQLGHVPRAVLHERVRRAFAVLEAARARGELVVYGVATWSGLRRAPGDAGALELERLVEVARSVGGNDHGLRVVQLPVSLALPEALTKSTQRVEGEVLCAIEAARRLGLVAIASGPLAQGELLKKPLPARTAALDPAGTLGPAARALLFARSSGVAATLVGASRRAHVDQAVAAAARPLATRDAALAAAGATPEGA
jgi:aryl-alcohol dehydrogenase-like predicted oxidoreductase